MSYILICPVKNEEQNLPRLAESIMEQTIQPVVWLIVDDGSTDDTSRVIDGLKRKFDCIYGAAFRDVVITQSEHPSIHFARIINYSFDEGQRICRSRGLDYQYIAKVDADFILPANYFERLIGEFEKTPKLGVASGQVYSARQEGGFTRLGRWSLDDNPTDGARIIRRECLEQVGNYPLIPAPDGDFVVLGRLKGWAAKRFDDIPIYELRPRVKGAFGAGWDGKASYVLDHHPFTVLLSAARMLVFRRPFWMAFAYLCGYFAAMVRREKKCDNPELRDYFRHQRPREIIKFVYSGLRRGLTH